MSKSILITGAGGNLGRAVSQQLLMKGYHIEATLGPHDDPAILSTGAHNCRNSKPI